MLFTHDVEDALLVAADLVNTAARGDELLVDVQDLDDFASRHQLSVRTTGGQAQVQQARVIRQRLRRAWEVAHDRDQMVAFLNAALDDSQARPLLTRHGDWDWHLHFTPLGAPIEQQVLAEAAMAMVVLFREDELARLKFCAGEQCDAVLVDLSRNRSKRYCDTANCGNRANVAAYRARRRVGADVPGSG